MIVAIEGLIPDRRPSSSSTHPAAPPVEPDIYIPDWLRKRQHQSGVEDLGDPVAATKIPPAAPQVHHPESTAERAPKTANGSSFPNLDPAPSPLNPFISPKP